MNPSRPLLRYHGGKWRIAPWIIAHFPPHLCYVEPFGGAASVLLRKSPSRVEVYNDLDGEVVNLFRVLRDPKKAEQLRRAVTLTPFSREEFDGAYKPARTCVERARRLIIRSFQGVGANAVQSQSRSGWRCRTARYARAGYDQDWANWPAEIPIFAERLRMVQIENRPAADLFEIHDWPDTLWYIDPPYLKTTRSRDHRSVYRHEMTDDDHRELCRRIRDLKGLVVASAYPNSAYQEELESHGWLTVTTSTRAQTNAARVEALYISPRTADRIQQTLFRERPA